MMPSVTSKAGKFTVLLTDSFSINDTKDEDGGGDDKTEISFLRIRHPKTGQKSLFIETLSGDGLRELSNYNEDYRSWFIGNRIEKDGKLVLATVFDAIYFLLPVLRRSTRPEPLDQLVSSYSPDGNDEDDDLVKIVENPKLLGNLNKIADSKGSPDLNVWIYNEEKTMNYLKDRIDRLVKVLKAQEIDVESHGATSSAYVKSSNPTDIDQSHFVKYAWGILSEYLEPDLSLKLKEELKIKDEDPAKKGVKRASAAHEASNENSRKKVKENPTEDYSITGSSSVSSTSTKPPPLNAKQKALAKSASGSKSISSFFKKK